MSRIHLDLETRCPVDIKAGTTRYTRECEIALVGMGEPGTGLVWVEEGADRLQRDLGKKDIYAFHAPFERGALAANGIPLPASRFHCTMAHAYSRAFKGNLREVGEQLGLPEGLLKQPGGTQLIRWFCVPPYKDPRQHPEKWEKFKLYCRQDVEAERAIFERLSAWSVTEEERETWLWNEAINDRGIPLDMSLIDNAIELSQTVLEDLRAEIEEITGLSNGNSVSQLTGWLEPVVLNLQKETVESALLRNDLQPDVRRVLELRQQAARSSVTKYEALRRAEIHGRIHGTIQFCAAGRTGRFGGRIFQPQNLPRPTVPAPATAADMLSAGQWGLFLACYHDPMEALASCIRGAVCASPGHLLVSVDFASIESRVLGWLAGCRWINETFAAGKDTYRAFAESWLRIPYDEVDKETRNLCKPPTLGCGFRLGAKGLVKYAAQYRVEMTEDQAESAVATFRAHCHEVVSLWYALETAALETVSSGSSTEAFGLRFELDGEMLTMRLPSGRRLYYWQPEIREETMPWGERKAVVTYMGANSYTNQWCRLTTHGGKWTENAVQAIARDILVEAGKRIADPIVLHVHDELVCEVPEERAPGCLEDMIRIMSTPVPWAPGLLLGAEGKISRRYGK